MARGQRLPSKPIVDNAGVRGNSVAAEFGGFDALSQATGTTVQAPTVNGTPNSPPKASAAPKGETKNLFTGLCEAINNFQLGLVKAGTYEKADQYEIVFVPASMANAQTKKPGNTDQSHTPMQQGTTAKTALDPDTNSVNVTGRTMPVRAGTQIIQFIDQVIRGSTYVSEQQTFLTNEVTQKTEKNPSGNDRPTAWYKISAQVTSLGLDNKRNDHAYKIVYIVTPYGINETRSQYFPQTSFRGVHKNYDYWFTGQNTAVLNYEQQLNNLYFAVLSESLNDRRQQVTNRDEAYKRSWQTRSNQSDQYATGATNEPAANLADFLYTPDDFTTVRLKIVGDPAWIPQGETSGGISQNNFSFAAFNSDDGINFDAQEVAFSVTFNQPEDYNLDTGLMEVAGNFKKANGEFGRNYPAQQQIYKTATIRHTFSRGSFTQELEGLLYLDISKSRTTNPQSATTRPVTPQPNTDSRTADAVIAASSQVGRGSSSAAEFGSNDDLLLATGSAEPPGTSTVPPDQNLDRNTQPLQQSEATSSGDLVPQTANYNVPPKIGTLRLNNGRIVDFFEPDRGSYERALASGATPVLTPPQYGNREA